jgi:hypothetical protein
MKADNICDVPGCGKPARTVKVSINTTDDAGNQIGVVMEQDCCAAHRSGGYQSLKAHCELKIEEAIKDNAKKV